MRGLFVTKILQFRDTSVTPSGRGRSIVRVMNNTTPTTDATQLTTASNWHCDPSCEYSPFAGEYSQHAHTSPHCGWIGYMIVTGSPRTFDGPNRGTIIEAMDLRDGHLPFEHSIKYYVRDEHGDITLPLVTDPEWLYHLEAQLSLRAIIVGV